MDHVRSRRPELEAFSPDQQFDPLSGGSFWRSARSRRHAPALSGPCSSCRTIAFQEMVLFTCSFPTAALSQVCEWMMETSSVRASRSIWVASCSRRSSRRDCVPQMTAAGHVEGGSQIPCLRLPCEYPAQAFCDGRAMGSRPRGVRDRDDGGAAPQEAVRTTLHLPPPLVGAWTAFRRDWYAIDIASKDIRDRESLAAHASRRSRCSLLSMRLLCFSKLRPHPDGGREVAVSKDGLQHRFVIPGTGLFSKSIVLQS